MKTYSVKANEIKREWHVIDAADKVLGKVATEAAELIMGKNKTMFTRNLDTGDYVVVINASKIKVTGKKLEQKEYIWHTNYPGGLRRKKMADVFKAQPDKVLKEAVMGMLPKNKLRDQMIKRLKIK